MAKDNTLVNGVIEEIKAASQESSEEDSSDKSSYQVVVSVSDDGIKGGEQVSLDIKKESNEKGYVLPKNGFIKIQQGAMSL